MIMKDSVTSADMLKFQLIVKTALRLLDRVMLPTSGTVGSGSLERDAGNEDCL